MTTTNIGKKTHCRICGSTKLNKFYFALDLSSKVGLYQFLNQDKSVDELIRPCECRGDFTFAHRICLADWIETTKHEYCDICRYRYNVKLIERSIFDWLSETQQAERILKTLGLALLVYYVGSLGILIDSKRASSRTLLELVVFTSSCIWLSFCSLYLAVYFHRLYRESNCWRDNNKRVFVEPNPNPQLDNEPRPRNELRSSGLRMSTLT